MNLIMTGAQGTGRLIARIVYGFILCGLALFLIPPALSQAAAVQRIVVRASNNDVLNYHYLRMPLPETINSRQYQQLRKYVGIKPDSASKYDLTTIFALTNWVHNRWQHDSLHRAPADATTLDILHAAERGERFSCVEYSQVLHDVLTAYGFVSRVVDLQTPDIAYAGLGHAHVAVEVYSDSLAKWVYLDPQWGVYLQHDFEPVNIYEYYQLVRQAREDEVKVLPVYSGHLSNSQDKTAQDYRDFIDQYLGFLSIDQLIDGQPANVVLGMKGENWPMTFQGLPRDGQIFTRNDKDIYFDLDRVNLVLNYHKDTQHLHHARLEINSADDYVNNMSSFAAVPDFDITPHANMPWQAHYEYRLDNGQWQRLRGKSLHWRLHDGENNLAVRAVNKAGHTGPVTFLRLAYTSLS